MTKTWVLACALAGMAACSAVFAAGSEFVKIDYRVEAPGVGLGDGWKSSFPWAFRSECVTGETVVTVVPETVRFGIRKELSDNGWGKVHLLVSVANEKMNLVSASLTEKARALDPEHFAQTCGSRFVGEIELGAVAYFTFKSYVSGEVAALPIEDLEVDNSEEGVAKLRTALESALPLLNQMVATWNHGCGYTFSPTNFWFEWDGYKPFEGCGTHTADSVIGNYRRFVELFRASEGRGRPVSAAMVPYPVR